MKQKIIIIFLLIMLAFPGEVSAASITPIISYQGKLLDSGGNPVSSTVSITFKLYQDQAGGLSFWYETKDVQVTNGIFNTYIGDTRPLNPSYFGNALWLEITVASETLTPRQQLSGSPYALYALSLSPSAEISNYTHNHDGRYGDIYSVIAGSGLSGGGVSGDVTLNVNFSGSGSAITASHSDHDHDNKYYNKSYVDALEARIAALEGIESRTAALERLLANVTRSGNDIIITGTNLNIRSGSGATDGVINGLGNLIIGYNELRGIDDNHSGSHNLILGSRHNYGSYGGLVTGYNNEISSPYTSISGGILNIAQGRYSSVSGGYNNKATGYYSSVSGGLNNNASSGYSSVSGGSSLKTTESREWATGGINSSSSDVYFNGTNVHITSGSGATDGSINGLGNLIIGYNEPRIGYLNNRTGSHNLIIGMNNNYNSFGGLVAGVWSEISGQFASVSGGYRNTATNWASSVSGGYNNTAMSYGSSVSGGYYNIASGLFSSVSGGALKSTSAESSWAGGAYHTP